MVINVYGNGLVKSDTYDSSNNPITVFYAKNAHGDVVNLTNSNGKNIKNYQYNAFGIEVNKDENDFNPFRYCGEYFDNETDNYYLRARYYNPSLGRFITEDPYWNINNMIYGDSWNSDNPQIDTNAIMQSSNLYAYCINNPIMYIDSSGLFGNNTVLEYGKNNSGRDVVKLQQILSQHKLLDNRYTYGVFDEYTLKAVNLYKSKYNLTNTGSFEGKVGATTWTHMGLKIDNEIEVSHSSVGQNGISSDGLYYSITGPTFQNGVNIISYNAGLAEIKKECEEYTVSLNVGSASVNAGTNSKGIVSSANVYLYSGQATKKINIPFTNNKIVVGVEVNVGVGVESKYNIDNNRIKLSNTPIIGGGVTIGIE